MLYNVLVSSVQQETSMAVWISHKYRYVPSLLTFSYPTLSHPSRLSQSTSLSSLCYTVALKLNFWCIWWLNVIFSDFFLLAAAESFFWGTKDENSSRTPIYKLFQFIQNLFYPHPHFVGLCPQSPSIQKQFSGTLGLCAVWKVWFY